MSASEFIVLPEAAAVAEAAADRLIDVARSAIEQRGAFRVALSGGSTPKAVYPLLTAEPRVGRVDWSRVEFFWGDDRSVPPDDPESNFGVAQRLLISRLPGVQSKRVHRMPADAADREAAARAYEADLRRVFNPRPGEPPAFDLIWLGMGPDGHTASLFPRSEGLDVTDRWVIANWAPALETWRMTLTFPVLDAARRVLFVVTGANKAPALAAVRSGGSGLPAARVHAERTTWLIDADAARGEAHAA
jgi:6-phosphogluconolactonase